MAKKVELNRLYKQAQVVAKALERHGQDLQKKGGAQDQMLQINDLVASLRCAPQSVHWAGAPSIMAPPRARALRPAKKGKGGKRT